MIIDDRIILRLTIIECLHSFDFSWLQMELNAR